MAGNKPTRVSSGEQWLTPSREPAKHAVVKAGFLAVGAASSSISTLILASGSEETSAVATLGIVVIGCIVTISMVVAAIYVWRH